MRRSFPSVAIALVLASLAALAVSAAAQGAAELYGRPLRGLSTVAVSEVLANGAKWSGRLIRVEGTLRRDASGSHLVQQGDSALPLDTDGSFRLPATAAGPVAAEGKVQAAETTLRLVASGVEIRK